MMNFLAVCIGGGMGAGLRYLLFLVVARVTGQSFPYGTLAANLLGCLLIGMLWQLFEMYRFTHEWRLFVFTGLLGGFTTFSTYGRETLQLFHMGAWKTGITYVAVSNGLGLVLVFLGISLARKLFMPPF